MNLSRHSGARIQQRAIPSLIAGLLLDHGSRMHRKGVEILFVDRTAGVRSAGQSAAIAICAP
jgi:hypothetical protein